MMEEAAAVSALIGRPVVDAAGHRLGRVIALIHRGDGCDVLLDHRRWLRHRVVRVGLDELTERDGLLTRVRPGLRIVPSDSADWVA